METDEYNSATSSEIKRKKKDLEKEVYDALEREKEAENRDAIVSEALTQIAKYEEKLVSINATKPWIPVEDMEKGWQKINDTKIWITLRANEQKVKKPWEPLAFKTGEINTKMEVVKKQIEKLSRMTKPKPKTP